MKITNEGHIERLQYGWWEAKQGHIILPYTLGAKTNFVMTHEELCHYDMALVEMHQWIDKERGRVASTLQALRKGRSMSRWQHDPTCFSIAHIMEGMVQVVKCKLNIMHLLLYIAKRRVDEQRQRGTFETHEGASSADS
jgi:hypothetical protein